jgi:hypothetical protein
VLELFQEYEKKIVPWLWTYAVFLILRFFGFLFFAIVNDLIFAYNILMVLVWICVLVGTAYGWLVVYSLYLELSDLSKLEDLAHLRVSLRFSLEFESFIYRSLISRWEQWPR